MGAASIAKVTNIEPRLDTLYDQMSVAYDQEKHVELEKLLRVYINQKPAAEQEG